MLGYVMACNVPKSLLCSAIVTSKADDERSDDEDEGEDIKKD